MGKRRNDHGSCTNDDHKRSKTIEDSPSPSHSSILVVPDTPQSQIKKKAPVPSTCPSEAKAPLLVVDDFDDEFSDEEPCNIDISAIDKIQSTFSSFTSYQRLYVLNVEEYEGTKVVLCQDAIKGGSIKLKCSGEWYFSKIEAGSYIHVISSGINKDEIEIRNDNSNMVIAYPDILVSPTTISSSVRCPRQAVLGEVFKPTVGYSCNEVMLQGTINHALFDVALREQKFDENFLKSKLDDVLESNEIIDSLSCMDLDKECMVEKITPNIKLLSNWANKLCRGNGTNVSYGQLGNEVSKIDKVLDIEENIWSPKYGFKGKVDATVRIHSKSKSHISPIEVKSGSSRNSLGSIDHRAQVILYTMMLEERYKDIVDKGLLYYIKGQQTIGVPSSGVERRALAMKRNEIAGALHDILNREKVHLPDLVNDTMACKYCNHQLSCSLSYRSFEDMDPDFHPYPEMLEKNTTSLSQVHLDYFKKFSLLCLLEAQTSNKSSKMPWDSSCKKYSKLSLTNVSSNHGFYHTFSLRFPINPRSTFLRLGDYAIISKEDGSAYNIVAGFVTSLSDTTLELYSMDTDLSASPHHRTGPSYFITPTSSLSSLHTSLGNLTSLMSPGHDRTEKWRRCVVEGTPPRFSNTLFSYVQEAGISREFAAGGEGELLLSLNEDQKAAVERAMSVEDYLCILGMPGTGKTSTISCLIQLLVARGNTVLLTAYTHSAVDNLVMKLPPALDVLRLGAPGRIHPANKCRSSQVLTSHIRDPRKLREFYQSKAVIATTCLGLKHSVFEYKKFDFCIIDEASQITQPICLGPLLLSDRCILVGDHHQLPPLVQSDRAREGGLGVSLFAHLCSLHPGTAVMELGIQYRMCRDIVLISNTLVYGGKLRCGSEGVANARLQLSLPDNATRFVKRCLSPASKVVFLDTTLLGSLSYETSTRTSISNTAEAKIVKCLCHEFVNAGVNEKDIGVLTPYNGQLDLLGESITLDTIELLTADRYQGRDKPCIIISFVRSNERKEVGTLLSDINRLNVAVTRAKCKLIMIGNSETLRNNALFEKLIAITEQKSWRCQIKEDEYEQL